MKHNIIKPAPFLAIAGFIAATTLFSHGSSIVTPTAWSNNGGSIDYNFDTTIDDSGLSSSLATGDAVPAVLPTHESPGDPQAFENVAGRFTSKDAVTTLTFDLGSSYTLDSLILWNGAEVWGGTYYNNRGLDSFTMSFSADGVTFTDAMAVDATIVGETTTFDAETFAISNVTAQYVQFSDLVNGAGNTAHTAISELRFTGTVVPEPSSAALLGLGGLALILRRRK